MKQFLSWLKAGLFKDFIAIVKDDSNKCKTCKGMLSLSTVGIQGERSKDLVAGIEGFFEQGQYQDRVRE